MTIISVEAVVSNGMLKPTTKLDLPEGARVHAELTLESSANETSSPLFGTFPELAALTDSDFEAAKQMWERSLEKQARAVDK